MPAVALALDASLARIGTTKGGGRGEKTIGESSRAEKSESEISHFRFLFFFKPKACAFRGSCQAAAHLYSSLHCPQRILLELFYDGPAAGEAGRTRRVRRRCVFELRRQQLASLSSLSLSYIG